MREQIDTKNTTWYEMIRKLAQKHNLGFLHNPGGGQFTNPDKRVNIQISTYDDEEDYRKLLAGLQKLGLEPDANCPMPDPTNAERQRRWRERQAGKQLPAVKLACSSCGKIHTGAHGSLCRDCFRQSPDGREWQRLRMASYRARRKRDNP